MFFRLKTDPASVIIAEELLDARVLKKLKKSRYDSDKLLYKIVNLVDSKSIFNEDKAPTRADYVEKREIDRSTLYSFDGPFQLLHADVGNLEFLGKNSTFPQYALVIVDLYLSKIYTYSMKSKIQVLQKLRLFCDDVRHERKGKRMRLQVNNKFQQVKIKYLNDKNNVKMFTSPIRGGKAFAAAQKIRELKARIAKINAQKLKISPAKIIQNSTLSMNLVKSTKYGFSLEEIEKRSFSGERFNTIFNMHRLDKTKKLYHRLDDYGVKKYSTKRRELRDELFIGEKVYVLAERIRKKNAPGKFYKQSVQNISYFNKDKTFIVRAIRSISGIKYYWLRNSETNRNLPKRFQRTEFFALKSNFSV